MQNDSLRKDILLPPLYKSVLARREKQVLRVWSVGRYHGTETPGDGRVGVFMWGTATG